MKSIYLLFTNNIVHLYGTWETANRIFLRAKRMGVKELQFLSKQVKPGDRYTGSTKVSDRRPELPLWANEEPVLVGPPLRISAEDRAIVRELDASARVE